MKEVKPLHNESNHPGISLPTFFTGTLYIYISQTCYTGPIISVSRCIRHILNINIFIGAFAIIALSWRAQLCTQRLKGIRFVYTSGKLPDYLWFGASQQSSSQGLAAKHRPKEEPWPTKARVQAHLPT